MYRCCQGRRYEMHERGRESAPPAGTRVQGKQHRLLTSAAAFFLDVGDAHTCAFGPACVGDSDREACVRLRVGGCTACLTVGGNEGGGKQALCTEATHLFLLSLWGGPGERGWSWGGRSHRGQRTISPTLAYTRRTYSDITDMKR